jgi:hypothetical protein
MALPFRPRLLSSILLGFGLLLALPAPPLPALAQSETARPEAPPLQSRISRAVNLARATAEARNGGDGTYSVAACMLRGDGGDCLIEDGDEGFVFRIPGGPPGWQEAGQRPSRETVIRVSRDGRTVIAVLYDGAPRPWKQRPKKRSGLWS